MRCLAATQPAWQVQPSVRTFLRTNTTKCLYCYFYRMARELGLIYQRVPKHRPRRLRVYGAGHSWLVRRLVRQQVRRLAPGCAARASMPSSLANFHVAVSVPDCTSLKP